MSEDKDAARLSDVDPADVLHTRIWREEAEPDNPYATRRAHCRGYDVFGDMLGRARWVDMLALLFMDELPPPAALDALEILAVALANPGPRDPSVHAAMCGGVGGSTAASCLIAALSVGAGRYHGARDVFEAMEGWQCCGTDLAAWAAFHRRPPPLEVEVWPAREHAAGGDPHGVSTATPVKQLLAALAAGGALPLVGWMAAQRSEFEAVAGCPLAISGVAAAVFSDLGFSPAQGEMLYLLLRLPGAAAHALEQQALGYKRFPFYPVDLQDDPLHQEAP